MNVIRRVPLLFCHHDLGLNAFDISSCSAQTDDGDNDNDNENDKDDDGDHSCYSSHWPTDVFDFREFFIIFSSIHRFKFICQKCIGSLAAVLHFMI